MKTHYVDEHITRKIRFNSFFGYFGSFAFRPLSFIEYNTEQCVHVPLKPLHIISKTLAGIIKTYFFLQGFTPSILEYCCC